jgi:hypothetical protein
LSVTFVGVVCDDYSDVQANRARNNIQESLRDLGPDSTYPSGAAVTPGPENAGMNSEHCSPLPGLQFTIGSGMVSKTTASYYLSYVSGATATVTTVASVPELDNQGRTVGNSTIPGAVTVTLDRETSIAQRGSLWAQGGTPSDPRPVDTTGAYDELSFAALRCAYDAVNGDNVEKVAFNSGSRHVYCYYYAIGHQVEAGTIVVQKVLAPDTIGQGVFRFDGDVSYADGNGDGVNDFSLTATKPGQIVSQSFVRAVGTPWHFQETLPSTADWVTPQSPVCVTTGGGQAEVVNDGADTHRTDGLHPTEVTLTEAGQTVTCTYTNARQAPGPTPQNYPFRRLWKEVIGSSGEFDFLVAFPGDLSPLEVDDVAAADDGTSSLVREESGSVASKAGLITVTEQVPATDTDAWALAQGSCAVTDGPDPDLSTAVSVPMTIGRDQVGNFTAQLSRPLTATENADCLITNTYTPTGRITIKKQVVSDGMVVADAFQPAQDGSLRADFEYVVLQQLVLSDDTNAVLAAYGLNAQITPDDIGDAVAAQHEGTVLPWPDGFPVSNPAGTRYRYVVEESTPVPTDRGDWQVDAVECVDSDGELVASSQNSGQVEFELTTAAPDVSCTFVNSWRPLALVTIVKQATADTDLRNGPARLDYFCNFREDNEGEVLFGNSVSVAAGLERSDTEFGSTLPLSCWVEESADQAGASPGVGWTVDLSLTNHGLPVPAPALGQPVDIDLGDEIVITATNVYTPPPPISLSLVKNSTADRSIRPDPAQLALTCQAGDATVLSGTLSLPAGESSQTQTFSYDDPPYDQDLVCQVSESTAGQAPAWQPSAQLSLTKNGQPWPDPVVLDQPFTVERGDLVEITVDNDFDPMPNRAVTKRTAGPAASFDFEIAFPGQPAVTAPALATPADGSVVVTELSGQPVTAAGPVRLVETVPDPSQAGGVWRLDSAVCQVTSLSGGATRQFGLVVSPDPEQPNRWLADSQSQSLDPTDSVSCELANVFTPAGRIDLTKTVDETGLVPADAFFPSDSAQFTYQVVQWAQDLTAAGSPLAPTGQKWTASAQTSSAAHVDVSALPVGAWPAGLPVSTDQTRYQYVITEQVPTVQAAGAGEWRVEDISCGAQTVATDLAAGAVTVEPTAAQPQVGCQFTNQWVPGAKLTIVKNATDDTSLRTGSAIIDYTCSYTEAGQPTVEFSQSIEVDPAAATGSNSFQVGSDIECTVTERATGAPPYVTPQVSLSATNQGQPVTWTPQLGQPFTVGMGDDVVFTVDNVYNAPTLQVALTKQTVSDVLLRSAPAELNLNCVSSLGYPSVGGDLPVAVGQASGTAQFQAHYPLTCVVTEPQSGVAPGYEVVSRASLSGDVGSTRVNQTLTLGEPFDLAPGDNVLVTVENIVRPQPSTATPWRFWKQARGADGVFDVTAEIGRGTTWLPVSDPALAVADGSQAAIGVIDPEDWPETWEGDFGVRLTEILPSSAVGEWSFDHAYCQVQSEDGETNQIPLDKVSGPGQTQVFEADKVFVWEDQIDCYIENDFVPAGRIQLAKQTVLNDSTLADDAYPGGEADFSFSVAQWSGPTADQIAPTGRSWTLRAQTTPDQKYDPKAVPGPADPSWPAGLPITSQDAVYRYLISETAPAPTAAGVWQLSGVVCGDAPVTEQPDGSFMVELTQATPAASCTFTNTWLQAATLTVTKTATTDTSLRPNPAQLALSCLPDDGHPAFATGVPVAAGAAQGSFAFQSGYAKLQCTVSEAPSLGGFTGAGAGVDVSASARISVNGLESALPAGGTDPFWASFEVLEGDQVAVTVDNVYTAQPAQLRLVKDVPVTSYQPVVAPVLGVNCVNQLGQTVLNDSLTWGPPAGQTATVVDFAPGPGPVQCVVTESVSGAGPGWALADYQVTGRLLPSGDVLVGLDLGEPFQIERGQEVEFSVSNDYAPAPTRRVLKQTVGATGAFRVFGSFPGDSGPWQLDQTTAAIDPGAPVEVVASEPDAIVSQTGPVALSEIVPQSDTGVWSLTSASCAVRPLDGGPGRVLALDVTLDPTDPNRWNADSQGDLAPTEQADCTLVNTFTPAGRINLTKSVDSDGPDPAAGLPARFDYTIVQLAGPAGGADPQPTGRTYSGQVALPDASLGLSGVPVQPGSSGLAWPAGFAVSDQSTTYLYQISESLPAPSAAGAWRVEDVTCQPASVLRSWTGSSATIELSAAQPVANCQFVNAWTPVAQVSLVKTGSADPSLRPGPALIDLVCRGAAPGSVANVRHQLTLPVGSGSASLSFSSGTDLICQVQESQSDTGADPASGVTWDWRLSLTNHGLPGSALALYQDFPVSQGDDLQIALDDHYTPPPPAQVTVVKTTSGDQSIRPNAAILNVNCQDQSGQTLVDGTVEVAPGSTQAEHLFQSSQPMSCRVTEASGGQGESHAVSASAQLRDAAGTVSPVELGQAFAVARGDRLTFSVDNQFQDLPRRQLSKQVLGGSGEFDFAILWPGQSQPQTVSDLGLTDGATVPVATVWGTAAGALQVTETGPDPAVAGGQWSLQSATCQVTEAGGAVSTVDLTVAPGSNQWTAQTGSDLPAGAGFDCQLVNQFIPAGQIQLRKTVSPDGLVAADALPAQFSYNVTQYAVDSLGQASPTGLVASGSVQMTAAQLSDQAVQPDSGWPAGFEVTTAAARYQYVISEVLPAPSLYGAWRVAGVSCVGAQPVTPWVSGPSVTVELTGAESAADCAFTNQWVEAPAASFNLVKIGSGDTGLRSGPAVLDYQCTETVAGQPLTFSQSLVLPTGQASVQTGFQSFAALTCQVTEPVTGAGDQVGASASLRLIRNGQEVVDPAPAFGVDFAVDLGDQVTFEVTNSYVPPAQVTVSKTTTGDRTVRPDPARLAVRCLDQDDLVVVDAVVTVDPGQTAADQLFRSDQTLSCQVTEPSSGAAAAYRADVSAELRDSAGQVVPAQLGQTFTVAPGQAVVFAVSNAFDQLPQRQVRKVAQGGAGQFGFEVAWPGQAPFSPPPITVGPAAPVTVASVWGDQPGHISLVETTPDPASAGGVWTLTGGSCQVTRPDGSVFDQAMTVSQGPAGSNRWQAQTSQPLGQGDAADCLLVNQFTPAGRIQLVKTVDPVGLVSYDGFPADFSYTVTQYAVDLAGQASPTGQVELASAHVDAAAFSDVVAGPGGDWPDGFLVTTGQSRYQYVITESLPSASFVGGWQVAGVSCQGGQTVAVSGASVTLELTAGSPEASCTFTNRWVEAPSGSLTIVKRGSDDLSLRSGAAVLSYQCVEQQAGQPIAFSQDLVLPPGASSTSTGFQSFAPLTCRVDETATGAAVGVTAGYQVQVTLNGQPLSPGPDLGQDFTVALGDQVVFQVDNSYQAPPPPARLTVTKHTSADPSVRDQAAQIDLTCRKDGQIELSGQVTVAPGLAAASGTFQVDGDALSCSVTESAAGAAAGYQGDQPTWTVANHDLPLSPQPAWGEPFTVQAGDDIALVVDNTFTALPPPPPEPYQRVHKQALGADGVFDFVVDYSDGSRQTVTGLSVAQATTAQVDAHTSQPGGPDQFLQVTEISAAGSAAGQWSLVAASCQVGPVGGGATRPVEMEIEQLSVDSWSATSREALSPDQNADCVLVNHFQPTGRIDLVKTVDPTGLTADAFPGGQADFSFSLTQLAGPDSSALAPTGRVYWAGASPDQTHLSVTAQPSGQGLPWPTGFPVTDADGHYQYVIAEVLPPPTAAGWWRLAQVVCSPDTAVVPGSQTADSITVEPTAGAATVECEFVNQWVPTARISLVKQATADLSLRSEAARLAVECSYQLPSGPVQLQHDVVLPPGLTSASLDLTAPGDLTCQVTEPQTGAGPAVEWSYSQSASDAGQPWPVPPLGQTFEVDAGHDVVYQVVNHYVRLAQISLTKTTTADQSVRPGPAQVAVRCLSRDDGSLQVDQTFEVPPGQSSASLAFQSSRPLSCVVTEPSAGQADGYTWSYALTAVNQLGPIEPAPELGQVIVVDPGDRLAIGLDNTFLPPPPPDPPVPGGGSTLAQIWLLAAGLCLVSGGAILLGSRRRPKRAF